MATKTYTFRDIITAALRLISVTDSNQTLDGEMVSQAMCTTQELLDSWNVQGALIYAQTISVFPILQQKRSYTIGPQVDNPGNILSLNVAGLSGGSGYTDGVYKNVSLTNGSGTGASADITVDLGSVITVVLQMGGINYLVGDSLSATLPNGTGFSISPLQIVEPTDFVIPSRPQYLTYASFQPSTTTPPIDLKLKIISPVEYAEIVSKEIGSGVPTQIYLDQTYPQGRVYLWNQPNQGGNLVLTYWQLLPSFSVDLDTVFTTTFPPGYMRLLRYGLAMNLAPEYGKSIPLDLASIVDGIKRDLFINNTTSDFATYNVPTGSGAYDAVSGTLYK